MRKWERVEESMCVCVCVCVCVCEREREREREGNLENGGKTNFPPKARKN